MSETRQDRFSALYDSTRPRLSAYALRRTSSPEDAADVVSETFEIAWRRIDDVPVGHDGLLWLYVTARYVLANHGRRRHRSDGIAERLAGELRKIPVAVDAADVDALVMRSCLDSLSADDRELLMLAGWEGLGAAEIGRVLGCSPTAARIRLHRARVRLNAAMTNGPAERKQPTWIEHAQDNGARNHSTPEEVLEQ